MAPFHVPKVVLSGFKEKIDSLIIRDDTLYLGTATGNLHVYGFDASQWDAPQLNLVQVKNLTKRSIEQLGFVRDINSLVILSEATVTLLPLPTFSPSTPLSKAKAALSFAVFSTTRQLKLEKDTTEEPDKSVQPIPMSMTQLLVGCRRKVVLYSWKDGEPQDAKEVSLPHSPRVVAFLDHDTACFAYTATDYALFQLSTMTASDIVFAPTTISASSTARGALTGLSGYMSLGFGAKAKPCVIAVDELEALVVKDNQGTFVGKDGKPSRSVHVEWPVAPGETTFIKPYLFSILPAGTVPIPSPAEGSSSSVNPTQSFVPTTVVQIRSSLSLLPVQTLPFPFVDSSGSYISLSTTLTAAQNAVVRLLTTSNHERPRLFMVTTPVDRAMAASEGSTIWQISMKTWSEQLDELVLEGRYSDALALLGVIDEAILPDKDQRAKRIRILNAVSQFKASNYDAAIDTFTELDVNPAKVVALYPESVSGRLAVPSDRWMPLFGGPEPVSVPVRQREDDGSESESSSKEEKTAVSQGARREVSTDAPPVVDTKPQTGLNMIPGLSASGSIKARLQQSDTASIISLRRGVPDEFHRSVETLVRYLSDRRPKIGAALQAVRITPRNQSHEIAPLSETPVEELFALPNAPLSVLTPAQQLRFAQIVDTALYKSYLIIRPSLLGSLCRVPNWCEVTEVEEDLRARQKYAELKDLYFGKKMHDKALNLLRELSEKEEDMYDKLQPTISYLQKLGPEHLEQIFKSARWVFGADQDMAFEIFTSEEVELPRQAVANYLDSINTKICARYLEHIIMEWHEEIPDYHDRLAVIYLDMTLDAKRDNDENARRENYEKLLAFIDSNQYYSVSRLFTLVSSTDLFEARAILLGRLGRHGQALELYVYRLRDYVKAEEYCQRVYQPGTETSNVFLSLLRLYLRPTVKTDSDLLQPAVELISRHSSRLDAAETLKLLPPLVTARDVSKFLSEALRAPLFDTRVVREISKARGEQVSRKLAALQARRVKVTDSRICPQCHKRIGNSVIAVHTPQYVAISLQCKMTMTDAPAVERLRIISVAKRSRGGFTN
ncbi:hypothetical protein AX15_001050 [Amanita polypyramis BW_CC]|nr:hypothetical protein AX15_001050 [Amanita polypyramis BW_CC]